MSNHKFSLTRIWIEIRAPTAWTNIEAEAALVHLDGMKARILEQIQTELEQWKGELEAEDITA